MTGTSTQATHRRSQWRKLASLTLAMLVLVGASLAWSAWRHQHPGPPLPVLIPGNIIQPPGR